MTAERKERDQQPQPALHYDSQGVWDELWAPNRTAFYRYGAGHPELMKNIRWILAFRGPQSRAEVGENMINPETLQSMDMADTGGTNAALKRDIPRIQEEVDRIVPTTNVDEVAPYYRYSGNVSVRDVVSVPTFYSRPDMRSLLKADIPIESLVFAAQRKYLRAIGDPFISYKIPRNRENSPHRINKGVKAFLEQNPDTVFRAQAMTAHPDATLDRSLQKIDLNDPMEVQLPFQAALVWKVLFSDSNARADVDNYEYIKRIATEQGYEFNMDVYLMGLHQLLSIQMYPHLIPEMKRLHDAGVFKNSAEMYQLIVQEIVGTVLYTIKERLPRGSVSTALTPLAISTDTLVLHPLAISAFKLGAEAFAANLHYAINEGKKYDIAVLSPYFGDMIQYLKDSEKLARPLLEHVTSNPDKQVLLGKMLTREVRELPQFEQRLVTLLHVYRRNPQLFNKTSPSNEPEAAIQALSDLQQDINDAGGKPTITQRIKARMMGTGSRNESI